MESRRAIAEIDASRDSLKLIPIFMKQKPVCLPSSRLFGLTDRVAALFTLRTLD